MNPLNAIDGYKSLAGFLLVVAGVVLGATKVVDATYATEITTLGLGLLGYGVASKIQKLADTTKQQGDRAAGDAAAERATQERIAAKK